MTNQIDYQGLQINTKQEVIDNLNASLQLIYGADINVDSNSPDGQLINIFAQVTTDLLELLVSVYNSFDPDIAVGAQLDSRVALNGITRIPGTFTIQNISVTVDRSVTLEGLDALENDINGTGFTVTDDAGTEFILIDTVALTTGTTVLPFRAAEIGTVEVLQNTITNIKTVTLGVTAVNNPAVATSIGINEETDSQLRVRREKALMLAAIGPVESVQAAILDATGVSDALVLENATDGVVLEMAPYSIWAIVENGADADIAAAIYATKAPGCAMNGAVEEIVARPHGASFTAKFDRAVNQDLYIQFNILPREYGEVFDADYIKAEIASRLTYTINESANVTDIIVLMQEIEPQGILTAVGVSAEDGNFTETLDVTAVKNKFVVSVDRIAINP
jgi:uncharacterized phage protein gp47/JayE